MKLQRYQDFIILEKFDDNIKAELNRLGVTDEKEIEQSKRDLDAKTFRQEYEATW